MRSGTGVRNSLSRVATGVAKESDRASGLVFVAATRARSWVIS